jgi:hypothetical protein
MMNNEKEREKKRDEEYEILVNILFSKFDWLM